MVKLLKKIKSFIPRGLEKSTVKEHEYAHFTISYKDLKVGTLELKDDLWHFAYSEAFKNQEQISPLPDFPDVNKIYTKEELWPFFIIRIPSLKQPKVQKIISKEEIDSTSQVELLKRFGEKSISNPFQLKFG
ncbi:MAG: HipA N-terminal domain-containing protein [Candidatus Paceibacterota bacterium]